MTDIVYSDKPIESVEKYLVCKNITGKWRVVASHKHYPLAEVSRDNRATADLITGRITDPHFYKIFFKDLVEIKEII